MEIGKMRATGTFEVTDLRGDMEPPLLAIIKLSKAADGTERPFSMWIPVRNPSLWQLLQKQVNKGQRITITVETDYDHPELRKDLIEFQIPAVEPASIIQPAAT